MTGWHDAQNFLAIRLDATENMGDVLMCGPAMRAVVDTLPRAKVTLLTSPGGVRTSRLLPFVSDAIAYTPPWMKSPNAALCPSRDLEMVELLRARRFDAAVIFTSYSQSPLPAAFLSYMAGIPLRLAHCRENPYDLLTSWVKESEPAEGIRHEVRRQIDLVKQVGLLPRDERMVAAAPPEARTRMRQKLGALVTEAFIVLHPGATAASRRYPAGRFAEAARLLVERTGYRVLVSGSSSEGDVASLVAQAGGPDVFDISGRLDLEEFAALIAEAPLLISNNTGPAHLAAAVGTPVVDLYALTNPQHTPWMVPNRVLFHDVACKYCYRSVCPLGHNNCLTLVEPASVVAAAEELLDSNSLSPTSPTIEETSHVYARH